MRKLTYIVLAVVVISGCATGENPKSETQNSELETRITGLVKALDDNKPAVREAATNELILIGKPAETYLQDTLKAIKGKNAEIEWRVKYILRIFDISKRIKFSDSLLKEFPSICRDLATDNANKKFEVLQHITEMGENRKPKYDVTDDNIARVIGETLLDGGKGLSQGQKVIICTIGAREYTKGITLEQHKTIPSPALHIKKLLKDEDVWVRVNAIRSLDKLRAKNAIPEIIELLRDSDAWVRERAVATLGNLGANDAIYKIKDLLKDNAAGVRRGAVYAVGILGGKEMIPEVKEMLKDEDVTVRSYTVVALSNLGAKETIPEIKEMLKDVNVVIRINAIYAVSKLGGKEAIPEVKKMLKDKDAVVRTTAVHCLGKIGAKDEISAIKELLNDTDDNVSKYAVFALRQLGVSEEEIEKAKK